MDNFHASSSSHSKKNRQPCCFAWSSPADACGIVILTFIFPFFALELVETGGWRGCDEDGTSDLPPGSATSGGLALLGTFSALVCRILPLWRSRGRRKLDRRRTAAITTLIISQLAMCSCALIPMSCGCLVDGKEWVYVSWRDYVHDASLWSIYLFSIIAGVLCGYHRSKRRLLFQSTCVLAILQSVGIWRCPISSARERVGLLALEVLAIAMAQFLHYGTIESLNNKSLRCERAMHPPAL